jgi:hypothetical protein
MVRMLIAIAAIGNVVFAPHSVIAQDSVIVLRNNADSTVPTAARDLKRREAIAARHMEQSRRLGRMFFLIPEYHDEQHFQISSNSFGPMAYIFASPFLGEFTRVSDIVEQGPYGVFAAIIEIDAPQDGTLPSQYTNLGLRPGGNCLWLANPTGNVSTGWEAYVTSVTPDEGCVRPPTNVPMPAKLLVYRSTPAGFTHDDYPSVARFGEARPSGTNLFGQPLLGVKCLDGWCEVGPSFPITPAATGGAANAKEGKIKGYHDEQILAAEDAAGVLRPTVRAVLEPVDGLDRLGLASFPITSPASASYNQGWILVARILLRDGDPPATSKYWGWGLRRGANHLYLRRIGPDTWQMSVINPTAASQIRYIWQNVARDPHTDILVPGTARWRFASFDPMGVWVRCGEACCSGDGGFQ